MAGAQHTPSFPHSTPSSSPSRFNAPGHQRSPENESPFLGFWCPRRHVPSSTFPPPWPSFPASPMYPCPRPLSGRGRGVRNSRVQGRQQHGCVPEEGGVPGARGGGGRSLRQRRPAQLQQQWLRRRAQQQPRLQRQRRRWPRGDRPRPVPFPPVTRTGSAIRVTPTRWWLAAARSVAAE